MKPHSIYLSSGRYMDLENFGEDDIRISDIARALSRIPRFGGHGKQFYSVARHSINVSEIVTPEYALEALLHDATEAYIGDLVTPIKSMASLDGFRALEHDLDAVIRSKYGICDDMTKTTKEADLVALREEKNLILGCYDEWPILAPVANISAAPLNAMSSPDQDEQDFINRFVELI